MRKKLLSRTVLRKFVMMLAIVLVMFSSVHVTQAAFRAYSEYHRTSLQTKVFDIAVIENGLETQNNYIMVDMVKNAGDTGFKIGKWYPEELALKNTSDSTSQYVRVTIKKYWVDHNGVEKEYGWIDGEGDKDLYLDPSLIRLHLINTDKWIEDVNDRTSERIVLYYTDKLAPAKETLPFVDKVAVAAETVQVLETAQEGSKTLYKFAYNGKGFVIEVAADSVQDHNVVDAMKSAWGVEAPQ